MAKSISRYERMRRTLLASYKYIIENGDFVADLSLLDALKDCIEGNSGGMSEWSISKNGKIRFR